MNGIKLSLNGNGVWECVGPFGGLQYDGLRERAIGG